MLAHRIAHDAKPPALQAANVHAIGASAGSVMVEDAVQN